MTEKEPQEQQRVSKREFLAQVSKNSSIPIRTVNRVYDTILAELMDIMQRGDQLMLTGFGKFYPQAHKGHRVQFADSSTEVIDDYFVLKFSATRSVNRALVQKPSTAQGEVAEESESVETDLDQDALFEDRPAAKTHKPAPATASLAAAATQSSRSLSRAKRKAVEQVLKETASNEVK